MNLYEIFQQHPLITTDSRSCPKGSIFFALKGERFNANEFAASALKNGCAYAVVDEAKYATDQRFILVDNTLKTLQELAKKHRQTLGTTIIGITGTNGKTTTKELLASVLKNKFNIHYTQGNLNNHIGVPLTLLQLKTEHQLAIIEMGANHIGEIKNLCEISQPNYGLITNVGIAHLEGFNSFDGVKQAKAELYDYIASEGLGVFINIDNEDLKEMAKKSQISEKKQIAYSLKPHSDPALVNAKVIANDPFLRILIQIGKEFEVNSQLIGSYNTENLLATATIAHFFGLNKAQIKQGLENYIPTNHRSQFIKTKNNQLIIDTYNANPSSMQASIKNFNQIKADNKMLILGDMLELGKSSVAEHQAIVDLLIDNKYNNVYLVGNEFWHSKNNFHKFKDIGQLTKHLSTNIIENQTILIKGSRGIQLENVISKL